MARNNRERFVRPSLKYVDDKKKQKRQDPLPPPTLTKLSGSAHEYDVLLRALLNSAFTALRFSSVYTIVLLVQIFLHKKNLCFFDGVCHPPPHKPSQFYHT